MCGLQQAKYVQPDPIFRNGFENPPLLPSGAGLGPPLATVMPPTLGQDPTLTVLSPLANASVDTEYLQLEGTFTGPAGTGVSINGEPAYIHQNKFVSAPLRVDSGLISLSVRASTIDYRSASVVLQVNAQPRTSGFFVSASSSAGLIPHKVQFGLRAVADSAPQSIRVDFNGDGTDDYVGSPGGIPLQTYNQAGIFLARFIILDALGQSQSITRRILVASVPETRTRICSSYAHLRARLRVNDVAGALQAIRFVQRPQYQELFSELGANRPVFADRLGTIANGLLSLSAAEFTVVTNVAGNFRGSAIRFSQSSDGVWRLDSL